jgi:hypothetical protein
MNSRISAILVAAVTATATAALVATAPAASAAVAQAEWTGAGGSSCAGTSCTFAAASSSCQEVTTVGNATITLSGCTARLSGSHSRVRSGDQVFCAGVGTGTLTYVDPLGTAYPPISVTVVVTDGTLTYHGTALVGVDVVHVQGTLTPGCDQSQLFDGTLSRV